MTFETAKILEILIHHKNKKEPLTRIELINESLIFEYGRVERILKDLKNEGYLSELKLGNGDTFMYYEISEKARECIFDLKSKHKKWWENNFVGVISLILSAIIVICTIIQTVYVVMSYHTSREDLYPHHQTDISEASEQ